MKDQRLQLNKKKELEAFVFEKITKLIEGKDSKRTFINERLVFVESIGLYAEDVPEDGEQINNVTVEMEMNEAGRSTRMVIDMGFDYDEIRKIKKK